MYERFNHIFLIILDSVRRDNFFYLIKEKFIPELREDFIDFRNCKSTYTNTFLSHYALFFGDYLNCAKNKSFPAQLKDLGYSNRSYCNYAVLLGYPNYDSSNLKLRERYRPSISQMIEDLGIDNNFDIDNINFGKKVEHYYGAADDISNKVPAKWKEFIQHIDSEKTFLYLHFWSTHQNYGINEYVRNKIRGKNYAELAKNLVQRIVNKNLTEKFVKKIYYKRILEVINEYIKDFIENLKAKGIYEESLIILTADHGEGLGDIGFNSTKRLLSVYHLIKRIYRKIRRDFIPRAPRFRKIFSCRWDRHVFFHNGGFEFQIQVHLFIKFPVQKFGGVIYYKEVSLFDIIHTINEFTGNALKMNNNHGCSLLYLITEGENAREKYKLKKNIEKIFQNP